MKTVVALLKLVAFATAAYSPERVYEGDNFFDGFYYKDAIDDLTHSDTFYVSRSLGRNMNLTYVNSANNAVIQTDHSPNLYDDWYRYSVRIESKEKVQKGNLIILDALHFPYGCSVWPAFWTYGTEWPNHGEIDIMEGVNMQRQNRISLHTSEGCTLDNDPSLFSGEVLATDCGSQDNGNEGCAIQESQPNSYGKAFNDNDGGVYAMEIADKGISVWFFDRYNIPDSALSDHPDPSGWAKPTAFFSAANCDVDTYFGPQRITLNIAICGDWADGAVSEECPYACSPFHPEWVEDAYFEIRSLKVFKQRPDTNKKTYAAQNGARKNYVEADGHSGHASSERTVVPDLDKK